MSDLLYCCKVRDESENYDLTVELLSSLDAYCSTFENKEENIVFHTVYSLEKAEALQVFEQLKTLIEEWKEYDVKLSHLEYFEMKKEDWSEVWKKYFNIIHIADNLVIRPSWLPYEPKPNQKVVDIDPGMSFGTGQHATTGYCLKTLARLAGLPHIAKLLDAGCGSGILAIAGAKLGFSPIDAFDYDPDAVMVAGENIEINHLGSQDINLFTADATKYEVADKYDLALVNILGHILKANAPRIISWVRPGGYLALAGILNSEFDELSKVFTNYGCVELDRFSEKEWTSGLFQVK